MTTRWGKGLTVCMVAVMVAVMVAGCASSNSGQGAAATSLSTAPPSTATPESTVPTPTAPTPTGPGVTGPGAPGPHQAPPASTTTTLPAAGPAAVSLIVEPDAGIAPIDALLQSPQHTLDMVMYELVDTTAEQILAADAARGVTVRVVLDDRLERRENTAAYQYLNAHGVHAVWAPVGYAATHEKAVVIDAGTPAARALIMTLNLTSRYYSDTRDFAVVDTDPADVAAIEAAFVANFEGQAPAEAQKGTDLVWSPNATSALVAMIGDASSTLTVENEEMSDPAIIDALEADARRGVQVHVTMTRDSEWTSSFDALSAAGVQVRTYADSDSVLYIHAKAIVADGRDAFVGSENFSDASLERNRELGLFILRPGPVVSALAATEASDWAAATPWSG